MLRFRVLAIVGMAGAGLLMAPAAQAMGTGDPYQDLQVGVTYTVYKPTFTAGLGMQQGGSDVTCPPGTEANLVVSYGKRTAKQFTVHEGNPMCSDIGQGKVVLTKKVNGIKMTVEAYCDPSAASDCTRADVRKFGGHLEAVFPAVGGLRTTTVWIETFGAKNLSANDLVKIAKRMKSVYQ